MSGNIILDGMISLFAAIGIASVVWIIVGIWIKPKSCEGVRAYTVLVVDKLNPQLYGVIRSMLWWQDSLPDDRETLLCGEFDDSEMDGFMRFSKRRGDFTVIKPDELWNYLCMRISGLDTGDTYGEGTYKTGGDC